jgi:biopolymer transport protein ExbD
MPKIKPAAHAPSIDMTPMVDLAFLLVTFFMLTASFRMAEPVIVDPPSSVSDKTLPENTVLITVDNIGRAFFGVGNGEARTNTLDKNEQKSMALNLTPTKLKSLVVYLALVLR